MIPKNDSVGGILLRTLQTDRFKSNLLAVSFSVPIEKETAPLLTLLLSVLRRGTTAYPEMYQLNRRLDMLYGTDVSVRNFYRGNRQVFGFCADFADASFLPDREEKLMENAVELIRELIYRPLLDENGLLSERYVESEKQQQIDQIKAAKNNPSAYAFDRCRELFYADEPCGNPILGTEEAIAAVTSEQLTELWRSTLLSLTPECFYVGSSEPENVENVLRDKLLPECGKNALPLDTISKVKSPDTVNRTESELPVSQSQLVLGFVFPITLGDEDYYAAAVLNELLGVSPIARLFMTVREKQGLCYSISTVYNAFKGAFFVGCGVSLKNREKAEREICNQIRLIQNGDFSDEELSAAKKSLENACRQMEDSPASLESFFSGRAQFGIARDLDERIRSYLSVTKDQVLLAAKKLELSVSYFLRGTKTQKERER